MLSYTHFTHDERISLHNFLKEGLGIREIARRLGRDPSTICRRRQQRRAAQAMAARYERKHERPAALFLPKGL